MRRAARRNRCWSAVVRRGILALGGLLAVLAPLPGYYHFLHVRQEGDALRAIPERFDLRALPDSAVPLVISKSVEPEFAEGDTWDAVVSEVKLAASQWSSVPHSALRLRYAGEVALEPPSGTPYVQVMVEELAPGVIAMAGPVAREAPSSDANGEFIPIARSVVMLSHRLRERPSYSEAFYMTLVHEMGHALGLQHAFAGSVMSTGVTRATTKATPFAEDDIAGLGALYPDSRFAADTGTIRGRVTADGAPLHFANVTALTPSGVAVSAMTLPDGSYEIRGVPPGGYYLYAQPVASSAQDGLGPGQIVLPKDENGNAIAAGGLFATRFYPDALDWHSGHELVAERGGVINDVSWNVPRVDSRAFADITTYSFPANFAVNPAVINTGGDRRFLVAYGPNLVEDGHKAEGLSVSSTAAGILDEDVRAYEPAPQFLRVDLTFHPFTASLGAKPLLWSRNGETFVQPAAFRMVGQQPPDVQEAQVVAGANGSDSVLLRGQQLAPSFTYLLDGLRAEKLLSTENTQSLEVSLRAPFTNDGRAARVVALGSDGQSSLYLNATPPAVATRSAGTSDFQLSAPILPAGAEAAIEVETSSNWFEEGQLGLSFNTPHVVARRIWRVSANRLVANVKAMASAPQGGVPLWLHKDLAIVNSGRSLGIVPPDGQTVSIDSRLTDESTGDATIYPGGTALLRISGEGLSDSILVRLADRLIPATRVDANLYRMEIPADLPQGLSRVEAVLPGRTTLPVMAELAGAPPAILEAQVFTRAAAQGGSNQHRARLLLRLDGLVFENLRAAGLIVRVNGRMIEAIEPSAPTEDRLPVAFDIPASLTSLAGDGAQPESVSIQVEWKGRHSAPVSLPLSAN
ncbi:MAG: carboxypeptidase regulatory-like domain-containing protein [Bryobacterales bacterium]|nr:carboxypeptidase regulatory-like domain-containing protein [Bryobacterales bacterium]